MQLKSFLMAACAGALLAWSVPASAQSFNAGNGNGNGNTGVGLGNGYGNNGGPNSNGNGNGGNNWGGNFASGGGIGGGNSLGSGNGLAGVTFGPGEPAPGGGSAYPLPTPPQSPNLPHWGGGHLPAPLPLPPAPPAWGQFLPGHGGPIGGVNWQQILSRLFGN